MPAMKPVSIAQSTATLRLPTASLLMTTTLAERLAPQWLELRETSLAREANDPARRANDVAREANKIARSNNFIAGLALFWAAIAITISIIGLFLKRG